MPSRKPFNPNRRRVFPPGTITKRREFRATLEEDCALIEKAWAADIPVADLLVESALNPARALTAAEAVTVAVELRAVAQEMARARVERRSHPAERDALDAYIVQHLDHIQALTDGLTAP